MFPHSDISPEPPLILVIDIGSSSTRAALYDAAATLVLGSLVQE
jgi:sugar (pentulose or hexulose) kinase